MADMMLVNARFRWSDCQLVSIDWGNSLAPNAVNHYLTKCWPTSDEYLHHHAIFAGHVSQTATSVTEISYPYIIQQEGCSGLATDSFCGVWGYGWTTCLPCGGPLLDLCFQTTMVCKFDIMERNFLLSYTFIIVFINYKSFTYHFPHIWFYSEIVLCTVISIDVVSTLSYWAHEYTSYYIKTMSLYTCRRWDAAPVCCAIVLCGKPKTVLVICSIETPHIIHMISAMTLLR